MKLNQSLQKLACLFLLAGLLAGCRATVSGGNRIEMATIDTLMTGVPCQEVIAELGEPSAYLEDRHVIVYRWTTNRGYRRYGFNGHDVAVWENEPHAYALCLRFDERQLLQSWVVLETVSLDTLPQEINRWVAMPVQPGKNGLVDGHR